MGNISKLKAFLMMEKLLTLRFLTYKLYARSPLKECVLNETQVDGIETIKTDMKIFYSRLENLSQKDLSQEPEVVEEGIKSCKQDLKKLQNFLIFYKEGYNEIENVLFQPLKDYIESLKDTIDFLQTMQSL